MSTHAHSGSFIYDKLRVAQEACGFLDWPLSHVIVTFHTESAHVPHNFIHTYFSHEFGHFWNVPTARAVGMLMDEVTTTLNLQFCIFVWLNAYV